MVVAGTALEKGYGRWGTVLEGGYVPGGYKPKGNTALWKGTTLPPPPCGWTNKCIDITFLQLCFRAVNIIKFFQNNPSLALNQPLL